ncbi:MAG TPA: transcription elongation factor GreA [Spirochaetota bacterium]|nr:transcription elongation factor GreA [Spirochaetota bacterium]HPI88104.1 transcription elongation factor GreA [Spirochaetota bacterium]HPR46411.1 transcription elongation factor GreA [Spirochaetota bacterium]
MSKEKALEKLNSLFKEEVWGRIEPKDIGISKFKILDDLFYTLGSEDLIKEATSACKKHLEEHPNSITALYLVGICGYQIDSIEDQVQLRRLIDIFTQSHKWAVLEKLSEKILEYGENSNALKSLALSLERQGRSREAIPVLENLLKIDRFDAELAKKLAFAIIDDDEEKSIQYMKLSIEGFIKIGKFDEVTSLWNKLVAVSWEDITFFERIERLLVEAKEFELAANLLKILLGKYKDRDNPDQTIEILKKILEYRSDDTHARKELIDFYRAKYGNHSQFEQFMKLSRLNNFKSPVKYAIQDFEKNIYFDKGNYAYHNSWGLGKIVDIDSESIIINFSGKPEHRMSIKMALQSLTPVSNDHLYVMEFEDAETVKNLFEEDIIEFFKILVKSYNGEITLEDIKKELISRYVDQKSWSKWWTRTRTAIKKDPLFGVSDKKKDLIYMRDKPVTFAEELLNSFTRSSSFTEKLDTAMEFINNISTDEGSSVSQYFIDYYLEEVKGNSATRQILSFFVLKDLVSYTDSSKLKLQPIYEKVINYIKESHELPLISMKIGSYDYKKDFVNLIEESREDWPQIFHDLLYETPVRIHKYIFNKLIRAHAYYIINTFIDRVITGAKQYPDIFIWVAKNLFTKTWDYQWLDFSWESFTITYFRLMNELKKIEIEGNRLKNMMVDTLFDNEAIVIKEIIDRSPGPFLAKLYDLFKNISYLDESKAEKFYSYIKDKNPDFQYAASTEDWDYQTEKLIVTQEGYDKMKRELERLVNEEMVNLSKELAKVSEATGDMRENVEYNALMEKQATLELAIKKLDEEMKIASVLQFDSISTETVTIGTKVLIQNVETGESSHYSVLGPWDADFEKMILSYRSPIAKALLGKKSGDTVIINLGDEGSTFKIMNIEKYRQ